MNCSLCSKAFQLSLTRKTPNVCVSHSRRMKEIEDKQLPLYSFFLHIIDHAYVQRDLAWRGLPFLLRALLFPPL